MEVAKRTSEMPEPGHMSFEEFLEKAVAERVASAEEPKDAVEPQVVEPLKASQLPEEIKDAMGLSAWPEHIQDAILSLGQAIAEHTETAVSEAATLEVMESTEEPKEIGLHYERPNILPDFKPPDYGRLWNCMKSAPFDAIDARAGQTTTTVGALATLIPRLTPHLLPLAGATYVSQAAVGLAYVSRCYYNKIRETPRVTFPQPDLLRQQSQLPTPDVFSFDRLNPQSKPGF